MGVPFYQNPFESIQCFSNIGATANDLYKWFSINFGISNTKGRIDNKVISEQANKEGTSESSDQIEFSDVADELKHNKYETFY